MGRARFGTRGGLGQVWRSRLNLWRWKLVALEVLQDGSDVVGNLDVTIVALGNMVAEGQRLAKMLVAEGQSVALVNARFAKPLDADCVMRYARRCGVVVTMEDHVLAGGFGSAVLECLSAEEIETPVVRVGWPDQFIEHGKPEALRAKYGLTAESALQRVRPHLKRAVGV